MALKTTLIMKKITLLFASGLILFSVTLFAQTKRAILQLPQASRENPTLFSTPFTATVNSVAEAQLAKLVNTQQLKHSSVHKPTVHAPYNLTPYVPIYDSIYYWDWSTTTKNWFTQANGKTVHITYDAKNNMTSEVYKNWSNSIWTSVDSTLYTSDANNNETSKIFYEWTNHSWTLIGEGLCTYDANNNETSEVNKSWSNSVWTDVDSDAYSYDANNNEISQTDYSWDTSSWQPYGEELNTYNASNDEVSVVDKNGSGSVWVNEDSAASIYNASNKSTNGVNYIWRSSVWVKNDSEVLTYNTANKLTRELYYNWNTTKWDTSAEHLFTYDTNNNKTSEIDREWSSIGWVTEVSDFFTYDIYNIEQSDAYREYDTTGKVTSGDSDYYYFNDVLGINNLAEQNENVLVYPNPSNGSFILSLSTVNEKCNVELFNMLGENIYQAKINSNNTEINLGRQPQGVYLYRVLKETGELIGEGKIVVEH